MDASDKGAVPRTFFRLLALVAAALACLLSPLAASAQAPGLSESGAQSNHIQAELVADGPALQGDTLTLALHFTPQPGWHGYWSNPGDAGYGMRLDWHLPAGWMAGEPQYPVPQQLVIAGLMNHVYEGPYAVLVPVKVPQGGAKSVVAPIEVKAEWLACTEEICVPEQGIFTLRVPTAQAPGTPARDPRFDQWRAAIPPLIDSRANFALTPDMVRIGIPLPASLKLDKLHVFIADEQLVSYAAPQTFRRQGDLLVAEIPRGGLKHEPTGVSGILALDGTGDGVRFAAEPGAVPSGGDLVDASGATTVLPPLWLLIAGALAGGLILNLMPCVFPILSLKALTLARAGEGEAQARREGLAYTGGVVLACVALGALLLALRAGGSEIGWAFQLQEPGVVVALLVLAVAITANFAGLFELPSLSITTSGGRMSAFATGLLAAFVATPCTGPFMAAALGAALLLPWAEALLLFAALGLGLALPFLLLGFIPPLRRLLPRPGRWMDWFRRAMAVPMGLTALALLWLCWRLGGAWFAVLAAGIALAALAALAQLWNRPVGEASRTRRWGVAATGLVGVLLAFALPTALASRPAQIAEESMLHPAAFSEAALADARASSKPVFVWFTADWCLTCKVNERVSIEREATREAFAKAGVVALRGDWTRRDPAITRFLTAHGVAGVPLYLWYPAGGPENSEPEPLPQVLTPDSLVRLASG